MLLLACVVFISCEREDNPYQSSDDSGRPIVFTAECDWPTMTKEAILDLEDIKDTGFRVWASWHRDPDDQSYRPVETTATFGSSGTAVTYQDNSWICDNEEQWNTGYYNFAAVIPASQFSGTHSATFQKRKASGVTTLSYSNTLTLDFGNSGFHLGSSQTDLMYAFHNEDNSADASSVVRLNFEHLCSLLTIKISSSDLGIIPTLKKLTLYGIHSTLIDDLTITQQATTTISASGNKQNNSTITNNISTVLQTASVSTESAPYWTMEYDEDDFDYDSAAIIVPVIKLLVFPEDLSEHPLRIKVEYEEAGITKTKTANIDSGQWISGESYVYSLII